MYATSVADMRRASGGQFLVEELNPDDDEEARSEASGIGIPPIEFNVLRDDEFQVRRGYFGLALLYADEREVIPIIDRTDDLEFRLASAVASMTSQSTPRLRFASGFGAKQATDFPTLQQEMSDLYSIGSVALDGDSVAPLNADSIQVLVVAGPTEPLSDLAVERISDYLDDGGAALLLLEGTTLDQQSPVSSPITSGLEAFLEERGLRYQPGIVYDLNSAERIQMGRQGMFAVVRPYPLWPILFRGADHASTRDLNNLAVGWASALVVTDSARAVPLWTTTEAGGVQNAGGPIMPEAQVYADPADWGVEVVAAAVELNPNADGDDSDDAADVGGRMIGRGRRELPRGAVCTSQPSESAVHGERHRLAGAGRSPHRHSLERSHPAAIGSRVGLRQERLEVGEPRGDPASLLPGGRLPRQWAADSGGAPLAGGR